MTSAPTFREEATSMEEMPMKKLKIKYGPLTLKCGEISLWAWGMLLCAAIILELGRAYLSGGL